MRLLSKFDIESSKGQSRKISSYKMRNENFYFYLLREIDHVRVGVRV